MQFSHVLPFSDSSNGAKLQPCHHWHVSATFDWQVMLWLYCYQPYVLLRVYNILGLFICIESFLPIASRSSASLEGFSSLNWGRDWELKGTADQWPAGEIRSLPDGLLQGFWCAWPQGDFDKPKWPFASEVNVRSSHLVAAKKEAVPERVQTNTSLAHHHM